MGNYTLFVEEKYKQRARLDLVMVEYNENKSRFIDKNLTLIS